MNQLNKTLIVRGCIWLAVNLVNFALIGYLSFAYTFIPLYLSGLILGIFIGATQWLVIRYFINRAFWWIIATSITISLTIPLIVWHRDYFILVALATGIIQWILLKLNSTKSSNLSWTWILVTSFCWCLYFFHYPGISIGITGTISDSLINFAILWLIYALLYSASTFAILMFPTQPRNSYAIANQQNTPAQEIARSFPYSLWIGTNVISLILGLLLSFPWFIAIAMRVASTYDNSLESTVAIKGAVFLGIIGGTVTGLIIGGLQLLLMKHYIPAKSTWLLINVFTFSLGLGFIGYRAVLAPHISFVPSMIALFLIAYSIWQHATIKTNLAPKQTGSSINRSAER